MHIDTDPAIFYLGTPVILVSTLNEDGTTNIAPMSSAWWLGWSCMLGLDASSKTTENLRRTGECVLNLPAADLVGVVDRLALLTGSASVPMHKKLLNYRHCQDKFGAAGLTPQASVAVNPSRIAECPIQLEARVVGIRPFAKEDPRMGIPACAIEVQVLRAHVEEHLLDKPGSRRINPDVWKPLIMSFRRFYSLTGEVHPSKLGEGSESNYAPWQSSGPKKLMGTVYRKWASRKYGVPDGDTESDHEVA